MRRLALFIAVVAAGCGGNRVTNVGANDTGLPPVVDGGHPDAGFEDGGWDAGGDAGFDAGEPDAGCDKPCGEVCCGENQFCNAETVCEDICVPDCTDKQCGDNGCGAPCGTCGIGETCDSAGHCLPCVPEDRDQFCARLQKTCGTVQAADNCGELKSYECGTCTIPQVCNETSHTCGPCVSLSRPAFCAALGVQCGPADGLDCFAPRHEEECGPCPGGYVCRPDGLCEACAQETDEEFCARLHKTCGTVTGIDNCGVGRTALNCGSCPNNDCAANNRCGNNDTCQNPTEVVFDSAGRASFTVETGSAMADDSVGSCYATVTGGKDFVFEFTLPTTLDVEITATGPVYAPYLYVRTDCDNGATEIACSVAKTAGITGHLSLRQLAAGTYYLWTDTYVSFGGAATVEIVTQPPQAGPANDHCTAPQVLTLSGQDTTGITASTNGSANDAVGSCSPSYGGDIIYAIDLPNDAAVQVTLSRIPGSSKYSPVIYLRSDCGDATTELGCAVGTGIPAHLAQPFLAAGTYYLFIDGNNVSNNDDGTAVTTGDFSLAVATAPVMLHDTCAGAFPLFIDWTTGTAQVSGDTSFATDSGYVYNCDSTTGPDLVYSFEIPAGTIKNVTVDVTPTPGSGLQPTVAIRRTCDAQSSELVCATKSSVAQVTVQAARLEPGTYYVWVDGSNYYMYGAFDLALTATDPIQRPDNDVCSGAIDLTPSTRTGFATATGSTTSALGDYTGSCATPTNNHDAGDVVYTFNVPSSEYVGVTVYREASSPSFRPAIYLRSSCGDTGSELATSCVNDVNGVAGFRKLLGQGTYYVIVDGVGGTTGDFRIDVVTYPATPPNDTCATAAKLDLGSGYAVVSGSNCGANDTDTSLNCSGIGADVIYYFDLLTTKNVTFALRAGHSDSQTLHLRRDCASTAADKTEVVCDQRSDGRNGFVAKQLAPGRYHLFIDSLITNYCGAYVLEATAVDPPVAPTYDTCTAPQPLVFNGNVAIATGDTRLGYDSGDGYCATATGEDLVYSFITNAPKIATVVVAGEPGSTLKPMVYLRSSCDLVSSETLCKSSTVTGGSLTATSHRLAAGTWYVWVDSAKRAYAGTFKLTVTLDDPPTNAPGNDLCANASPLNLTEATPSVQVTGTTVNATDDSRGLCGTATAPHNGPDVVYKFTLNTEAAVKVKLTRDAASTTYKPALYLRTSCVGIGGLDEGGCANAVTASGVTTAEISSTFPAGDYLVFVDGADNTAGGYTLELTRSAAVPGESCFNPEVIGFGSGDTITLQPDTSLAANNGHGTCNASSGADYVYRLDLVTDERIDVTVQQAASSYRPNFYLRRGSCSDPAAEFYCLSNSTATTAQTQKFNRLTAGTYYLWLDSATASAVGPATLTVARSTPPVLPGHDTCSRAMPIAIDPVTGVGHVTDTTAGAFNDFAGSCAVSTALHDGADVVYSISVTDPSTIIASITRGAADTDFAPVLYLRRDCASAAAADEVACTANTNSAAKRTLTAPNLARGTYYLFVDGVNRSFGGFNLDVAVRPNVANDDCTNPETLTFDLNGVAQVVSDTSLGTSTTSGSCSSTTTKDLVYKFTTGAVKNLQIDLFSHGVLSPDVYLRTTCGDTASQVANACVHRTSAGDAQLVLANIPANTYYLWVDSYSDSSAGAFTLKVTATDPNGAPANDLCTTPREIPLTSNATGGEEGSLLAQDTTNANDNYSGSCGTHNGPDVAYFFTLSQDSQVKVEVKPVSSPTFKPAVYLRRSCATAGGAPNEIACKQATTGGATVTSDAKAFAAGTYYVIVDGNGGTLGVFDIKVTANPAAPGDACFNAVRVDPESDPGLSVSFVRDTTGLSDDYAGSCYSTNNAEVVYTFTTRQPHDLKVRAVASGGSFKPLIYVRSDCEQTSTELACSQNSFTAPTEQVLVKRAIPPGTYFVFFDSGSSSALTGSIDATISLADQGTPPPNDTCANAIAQSIPVPSGSPVVFSADTSTAMDDYSGTCATATHKLNGLDVVYSFNLARDAIVSITVTADVSAGNYWEAVYVRRVCDSAAASDEVACNYAVGASASAKLTNLIMPAGTYYLIVDGADSTAGGAQVSVTTVPLLPGDECFSAVPLDLSSGSASVSGTTVGGNGSAGGSCYTTSGPDVVYSLSLQNESQLVVNVTSQTLKPMVYLRTTCSDNATELACATNNAAVPTGFTIGRLPAGTYYLWVDGYSTSSGDFTLDVQVSSPTAPANDTCVGAQDMVYNASTGKFTQIIDDTSAAADDAIGTCMTGSSRDLVYRLVVPGPDAKTLSVTVAQDKTVGRIAPYLFLREFCDRTAATNEVRCVGNSGSSTSTTLKVNSVPPGTYYLFVDGAGSTWGRFKLDATITPMTPNAPQNDTCYQAEPLSFNGGPTANATGTTVNALGDAGGSCGETSSRVDVVYSFELAQAQGITATVAPATGVNTQPVLFVRSDCGSTLANRERGCALAASAGGTAQLDIKYLPAGTYWIWVEGKGTATGAFNLQVVQQPPVVPPLNDVCAFAEPVALGIPVSADTTNAVDDYGAALAGCGGLSVLSGPDLVYAYTPTVTGAFTATLTPAASWDAGIWVTTGSCGGDGAACIAGHDGTGGAGESESVTVNGVANQTYFIIVDGFRRGDAGTFTLLVH